MSRLPSVSIGPMLTERTVGQLVSSAYQSNGSSELSLLRQTFLIKGALSLSHKGISENKSTYCEICFGPNWLADMPWVRVSSASLWRGGDDWHCNKDSGRICYAHELDWQNNVRELLDQYGSHGLYLAGDHLVDLICSLVYRHLLARRSRMLSWPSEWGYRPHTDRAARAAIRRENPDCVRLEVADTVRILKQYD